MFKCFIANPVPQTRLWGGDSKHIFTLSMFSEMGLAFEVVLVMRMGNEVVLVMRMGNEVVWDMRMRN